MCWSWVGMAYSLAFKLRLRLMIQPLSHEYLLEHLTKKKGKLLKKRVAFGEGLADLSYGRSVREEQIGGWSMRWSKGKGAASFIEQFATNHPS